MRLLGQGIALHTTGLLCGPSVPPQFGGLKECEPQQALVQRELEFPRNLGIGICLLMDEGASLEPKVASYFPQMVKTLRFNIFRLISEKLSKGLISFLSVWEASLWV